MVAINRTTLAGTCNSSYFYDLGHAHGKPRANTLETFADALITKGYTAVNVCMTNSSQTVERGYLKELGFTETKGNNNMMIHTIGGSDLEKSLKPFKESRAKRQAEAAEKKAREEIAKSKEVFDKWKKQVVDAKFDGKSKPVPAAVIGSILKELPITIPLQTVNKEVFGIPDTVLTAFNRSYHTQQEIAFGINYYLSLNNPATVEHTV